MTSQNLKIAIIGAGNLGLSLASQCYRQNLNLAVGTRDVVKTQERIKQLQLSPELSQMAGSVDDALKDAGIILLTVCDAAIENTCISLSKLFARESVVIHFSGSLDHTVLHAAEQADCYVASAHPLNSFPNPVAGARLLARPNHNTPLFCEGNQPALITVESLFKQLGFVVHLVENFDKNLYHCAAVMACNYLATLVDTSLRTAELAGIDKSVFWPAVLPLIETTLTNISEHGVNKALSGPIARADTEVVARHRSALLERESTLAEAYSKLGEYTAHLALRNGQLDDQTLKKILDLLNS